MSRPVLEVTGHRLRVLLAEEQARGRLPSVVAGVVREGSLVWSARRGAALGDAAGGAGADPTEVQYRIGSLTKTMTAALVMQLRDEGALDLADRLDQHLPGVGYGDRTLRSLLSHVSGMQAEPAGEWWERTPGGSFAELAAAIDEEQAPLPPGAEYHYTNLAFGLLGELVARKRGTSWWEQVAERILAPLGMARTSYLPEAPHATGYSVHPYAGLLSEEPATDTGAMAPAGQVWSTLADLGRYAGFLLDGHPDVLPAATLAEMATPQGGTRAGGLSGGYGLGLRLVAGGSGTLVGHTGSMPGFLAGLFVDPVRRTAAACLANGTTGMRCEGLPVDLLDTLEEVEPTPVHAWEPSTAVSPALTGLLGVWHWGNTGYVFAEVAGELHVRQLATGTLVHRFAEQEDGTFRGLAGYHLGETLRAVRDADGRVHHLVCSTFVYTRAPYDPTAPIPGGPPA